MSWLPTSFSSISDQLTTLLTENPIPANDTVSELKEVKSKIDDLEWICSSQKNEIGLLKKQHEEMLLQIQSKDILLDSTKENYHSFMNSKENEVKYLRGLLFEQDSQNLSPLSNKHPDLIDMALVGENNALSTIFHEKHLAHQRLNDAILLDDSNCENNEIIKKRDNQIEKLLSENKALTQMLQTSKSFTEIEYKSSNESKTLLTDIKNMKINENPHDLLLGDELAFPPHVESYSKELLYKVFNSDEKKDCEALKLCYNNISKLVALKENIFDDFLKKESYLQSKIETLDNLQKQIISINNYVFSLYNKNCDLKLKLSDKELIINSLNDKIMEFDIFNKNDLTEKVEKSDKYLNSKLNDINYTEETTSTPSRNKFILNEEQNLFKLNQSTDGFSEDVADEISFNMDNDDLIRDEIQMHKEAVHKLSHIIKERDMQIEALMSKNTTLTQILQASKSNDVKTKYHESFNFSKENLNPSYQAEIKYDISLKSLNSLASENLHQQLGDKLNNSSEQQINRLHSETQDMLIEYIPDQYMEDIESIEIRNVEEYFNNKPDDGVDTNSSKFEGINQDFVQTSSNKEDQNVIIIQLRNSLTETNSKRRQVEDQLNILRANYEQVVNTAQMKHEESLNYYNEACRLTDSLTQQSKVVLDLRNLLTNFEREVASLKNMNANLVTRDEKLVQEVERLRRHLLRIEDANTEQLVDAQEKNILLTKRLTEAEEKIANLGKVDASRSIEYIRRIEELQNQISQISDERDDVLVQLSTAQETISTYASSLANLELVLEQFQQNHYHNQILELENLNDLLRKRDGELDQAKMACKILQEQIDDQKQALEAARRLTERSNEKDRMINGLKKEASELARMLEDAKLKEDQVKVLVDGKVDKLLIKSLLIGYFHAPVAKRPEAFQVIASVLQFSKKELEETGMKKADTRGDAESSKHSFSQLFVTFLEKESKPSASVPHLPIPEPVDTKVQKVPTIPTFAPETRKPTTPFNPFAYSAQVTNNSNNLLPKNTLPLNSNFLTEERGGSWHLNRETSAKNNIGLNSSLLTSLNDSTSVLAQAFTTPSILLPNNVITMSAINKS